jgi:hypothetical protein
MGGRRLGTQGQGQWLGLPGRFIRVTTHSTLSRKQNTIPAAPLHTRRAGPQRALPGLWDRQSGL